MNKINNKDAWLTKGQLKAIEHEIQEALLKRQFLAPIKFLSENISKRNIEFETEDFQTAPVIFKRLHVSNFSSFLSKKVEVLSDEADEPFREFIAVSIYVAVKTETFDNGRNSTDLFHFYGEAHKDSDSKIFRVTIV